MTMRNGWEFEYTGAKLAEAAALQRDFRIERVRVWEEQKAAVVQRIRESGININDSLVEKLRNNPDTAKYLGTRAQRGAQITIDETMQTDLDECFLKIHEHMRLRNEYAAWYQVFVAHPEARVKLHHDDWIYFFLRSVTQE